jgi:hypothetical protein
MVLSLKCTLLSLRDPCAMAVRLSLEDSTHGNKRFFGVLLEERLFLRKKKSTTFFQARISRSGEGRVSDFSATRVRVEGVGPPRVAEKGYARGPVRKWNSRSVKKYLRTGPRA